MKDLLDRAWQLGFDEGVEQGTVDVTEQPYVTLESMSPSAWTEFLVVQMGHTGSHWVLCGREPYPDDEPLYEACLEWYGRGCYEGYRRTVGSAASSSLSSSSSVES